jgi:predicted kinase
VGYFLAGDHLRAGTSVVADSVNPIEITRAAWRGVAIDSGARVLEVEVVCGDPDEHRRRVEARGADIPGHAQPTWADVVEREFEPLADAPLVVRVDMLDGPTEPVAQVRRALAGGSVGQ